MQQFPREQTRFSEPVCTGGNNLQSNSDLGLKARGQRWKVFPLPPSSHQQASPPSSSILAQSLTEERQWELQMRSICTLAAPLSTTQLSTPNDEPKAEPTAKRGKALWSTCPSSLHHNSLHADLSQPATLRLVLFTKQARRPPLPPLQICRIGFRATHGNSASVPGKQGPAGSSSQALSLSPGQPWLQERSSLSPFSHTCLLTAAAVQEKSDTTGQRDRCSTRLKWGKAPTKASSALRLPQEKLRKKFFSNARKPWEKSLKRQKHHC